MTAQLFESPATHQPNGEDCRRCSRKNLDYPFICECADVVTLPRGWCGCAPPEFTADPGDCETHDRAEAGCSCGGNGAVHYRAGKHEPVADILRARWVDILDVTLQMVISDPERRRWLAESLAGDVGVVRDRYVEQLEAGRETWKAKAEEMEADRDRLAAQIARARAIHHPVTIMGQVWCDECSTQRSTGPRTWERIAYMPHPCQTVQALDAATT